jgi:hypothetical protein
MLSWIRAVFVAAAVIVVADLGSVMAQAQRAPLPLVDRDVHMGVASCAGSTCHGAVAPLPGIGILMNEFTTWQQKDKHATAYRVLLNDRSKRIAKNLGLEAAHTAAICLDCHADNPGADRRHRTFQITDGVSCEACHGGAGRWIGTHIAANATHARNIENGMFPSASPTDRARLCLSCHFGDERRFVTHRIMGAGHPRMSFELDTFTALQPAHFVVDNDYRQRKGTWNGVQVWAIGQAMAISTVMERLSDPKHNRDGLFPELVFFDCHSCHSPMSELNWAPRASTGLAPGVPKLNDSNFLMLQIIADRADAALGRQLKERTLALHRASSQSLDAMVAEARQVKAIADQLLPRFAQRQFGNDDVRAIMGGIIDNGLSGEYVDYAGAEQATMALGTILNAMRQTGMIDQGRFNQANAVLDKVFEAVKSDERYKPETFLAALREYRDKAP